MLLKGEEVPRNTAKGIFLYESVAPQLPVAWLRLAKTYLNDVAVPHDYSQAASYCTKAADAKLVAGMVCLAFMNAEGYLGSDKEQEAFHWYDRAVHLGSPVAAFAMGVMYAKGMGTSKDLDRSFIFLSMAKAALVAQAGPLLDSVGAQLDPKKIAKLTE